MRAFNRCLGLLAASLLLASCGGGGGSGGDGAFQPTPSGTLDIRATTTTLPLNLNGVGPFPGSPFLTEVDVTWRRANGDLVTGQEIAVSINPVTVAAFSTLDDPATTVQTNPDGSYLRGNEFLDLLGSGPVDVTGGHATIFVHSDNVSGTATLTVTARDTGSNTTISKTMTFTVAAATTPLPASIALVANPSQVYLQENGGSSNSVLSAVVRDGSGQLVPDPVAGNTAFNNLQLEIVGGANYGNLSAVGATGAVSGTTIKVRTIQGVTAASFSAGTIQGPIQIRATADRADGNVDNGITNPVTVTQTITVSDGKLFSLAITSPNVNAILANRVLNTPIQSDNDDGPPAANGTYSLIVSALATDRQGNPVPAGTVVRFGAIDSPIADFPNQGSGRFLIGGNDGNPQESGTLFTSVTGCFTGFIKPTDPRCSSTGPGERPGPGDTLLTFGDLVLGNRDLESARTLSNINSATSLNVSVPFNRNDDSGNSLDSGAVIPYVIGRAQDVTIRDQGQISLPGLPNTGTLGVTDRNGVASAVLTYPVSKLGKATYIYAQSDGVGFNGQIKKVTDIAGIALPGVAPALLTVNPTEIPGNATAFVTICIIDKFNSPLQGVSINYSFVGLPVGAQGSVDGNGPSGRTDNATGANGCVLAQVVTTGMGDTGGSGGNTDPMVVFSALGLEPGEVNITANGNRSLTAQPGAFRGGGGTVTLTLRDAAGNPVPGVLITGTCTGDVGISTQPGVTNAQGQTTAVVSDNGLNGYGEAGEGECTFTASSGEETTVTFTGIDFCESGAVSPPPPPELCGGTATTFDLTVVVNPTAAGTPSCGLTVTSTPIGIACSAPAGNAAVNCVAPFNQGVAVTLTATPTGANCPPAALPPNPPTRTVTFSGQCAQSGPLTGTATMSSARTCNVAVTIP